MLWCRSFLCFPCGLSRRKFLGWEIFFLLNRMSALCKLWSLIIYLENEALCFLYAVTNRAHMPWLWTSDKNILPMGNSFYSCVILETWSKIDSCVDKAFLYPSWQLGVFASSHTSVAFVCRFFPFFYSTLQPQQVIYVQNGASYGWSEAGCTKSVISNARFGAFTLSRQDSL